MVILDTNIVIDHLRQLPEKSKLLKLFKEQPEERFTISLVSLQELYEGKSTRTAENEKDLLSTLSRFEIMPYTYDIAKKAGLIIRDEKKDMGFADAAIAATAIVNGCSLVTLNTKDFKGIKELDLL